MQDEVGERWRDRESSKERERERERKQTPDRSRHVYKRKQAVAPPVIPLIAPRAIQRDHDPPTPIYAPTTPRSVQSLQTQP